MESKQKITRILEKNGLYDETTIEEEMPCLLNRLRTWLEFEPTIFELKELYQHLKASVENYNRDMQLRKLDNLTIPDVGYEALIRFLNYEYKIIRDEKDFLNQYSTNRGNFISRLKSIQAKKSHFEYGGEK